MTAIVTSINAGISAADAAQTTATVLTAPVVTTSTTEIVMLSALVPANRVSVGTTYRITMFGVTAASGNPTFKVHLGAAGTIADALAATIGPVTSTVAAGGWIEFLMTFRAAGVGGSAMVNGNAQLAGVINAQTAAAPVVTAVDTTGARYVTVTAAMSASTFTAHTASIEVVRL